MVKFQAVSCILLYDEKILLLKRSYRVKTNRGLWSVVAGEVEGDPYRTALNEIEEETGLAKSEIVFILRGKPFDVSLTKNSMTTIHPFLFSTIKNEIRLNWEHDEFRWISPKAIEELKLVPRFSDMLRSIALIS